MVASFKSAKDSLKSSNIIVVLYTRSASVEDLISFMHNLIFYCLQQLIHNQYKVWSFKHFKMMSYLSSNIYSIDTDYKRAVSM